VNAKNFFTELRRRNVYKVAIAYAVVAWLLEQGVANHEGQPITSIKVHPLLDPLRGDPRFETLVQKVVGPKQK
jgi:hypothetical protein